MHEHTIEPTSTPEVIERGKLVWWKTQSGTSLLGVVLSVFNDSEGNTMVAGQLMGKQFFLVPLSSCRLAKQSDIPTPRVIEHTCEGKKLPKEP